MPPSPPARVYAEVAFGYVELEKEVTQQRNSERKPYETPENPDRTRRILDLPAPNQVDDQHQPELLDDVPRRFEEKNEDSGRRLTLGCVPIIRFREAHRAF